MESLKIPNKSSSNSLPVWSKVCVIVIIKPRQTSSSETLSEVAFKESMVRRVLFE